MIQELQSLFGSIAKSLEILLVLKGAKPVARILVKEEDYEQIHHFLKDRGLTAVLQGFKLEKVEENAVYSNKGMKLKLTDPRKGYYLAYVSKSKQKAEEAKIAEFDNKHVELGLTLGYPTCCAEFFDKYFPVQSQKNNDFVLPSLKESAGFRFPWWNNVAVRHLDISLLSHFPCNFHCDKSIALAKKYFEVLNKDSPELAKLFEIMMKGAVLYTEDQGIFVFRQPRLEGNKLCFNGIVAEANNPLYSSLKLCSHIEIVDKNHIKFGSEEAKGEGVGFMLFE